MEAVTRAAAGRNAQPIAAIFRFTAIERLYLAGSAHRAARGRMQARDLRRAIAGTFASQNEVTDAVGVSNEAPPSPPRTAGARPIYQPR
jgi:hypothetical protein